MSNKKSGGGKEEISAGGERMKSGGNHNRWQGTVRGVRAWHIQMDLLDDLPFTTASAIKSASTSGPVDFLLPLLLNLSMLYSLYKGTAGEGTLIPGLALHCFPSDQTDGRGHVFIEMKMFQLLITEATGKKKKINSHFNGNHLSRRLCRLVSSDSKFNLKKVRGWTKRTTAAWSGKRGTLECTYAACVSPMSPRQTDKWTFPFGFCFFNWSQESRKGSGAPRAGEATRKYLVKGSCASMLVEDSFLWSLTFKLEVLQFKKKPKKQYHQLQVSPV